MAVIPEVFAMPRKADPISNPLGKLTTPRNPSFAHGQM